MEVLTNFVEGQVGGGADVAEALTVLEGHSWVMCALALCLRRRLACPHPCEGGWSGVVWVSAALCLEKCRQYQTQECWCVCEFHVEC